ncbi:MAG: 3-deoxy-8-phosphooctulonate synthase, partial [Opitutales bacterium]|nr:3-deoxy-8-phosphooctulonate synthase [Opitutales bacterium]
QAALASGAQGLFVETHPHPEAAWSDQATQLPLRQLPKAIEKCLKIWECARAAED